MLDLLFTIVPIIILLTSLTFGLSRWLKLAIYSVSGQGTKGKIVKIKKSKKLKKVQSETNYHEVHYVYYDESNVLRKGRMHKLYYPNQFEVGEEIDVIYLPKRPKKSIVHLWNEFFLYEMFAMFVVISLSKVTFR